MSETENEMKLKTLNDLSDYSRGAIDTFSITIQDYSHFTNYVKKHSGVVGYWDDIDYNMLNYFAKVNKVKKCSHCGE